jgi:hypothetical protein
MEWEDGKRRNIASKQLRYQYIQKCCLLKFYFVFKVLLYI